jgi:hypothetical protein
MLALNAIECVKADLNFSNLRDFHANRAEIVYVRVPIIS